MSTLTELAQQIAQLYPLQDKRVGKRYRVVGELAGMTELEEINGEPRYIQTLALRDRQRWELVVGRATRVATPELRRLAARCGKPLRPLRIIEKGPGNEAAALLAL